MANFVSLARNSVCLAVPGVLFITKACFLFFCFYLSSLCAQNLNETYKSYESHDVALESVFDKLFLDDYVVYINYFAEENIFYEKKDSFARAISFFWQQVIEKNYEIIDIAPSLDNKYKAVLFFDKNSSAYLKILDLETSHILYHSFDPKFRPEKRNFREFKLRFPSKVFKNLTRPFTNEDLLHAFKVDPTKLNRQTRLFQKILEVRKNEVADIVDASEELIGEYERIRQIRSDLTEKEFREQVVKKGFLYVETLNCFAEFNATSSKSFFRIVHKETERVFLFYLKEDFDPDSYEQKDYIRKQTNLSGAARKDHKFGRDVFVIVLDHDKFISLSQDDVLNPKEFFYFVRHEIAINIKNLKALLTDPSEYGKSLYMWVSDYAKAIYSRPNLSTASLGIVTGLGQTGITVGLLMLFSELSEHFATSFETQSLSDFKVVLSTIVLPIIWGTPVAIFSRTYKNFITHGTLLSRWLKNMFVSMSSYMLFSYALRGSEAFSPYFFYNMGIILVTQNLFRSLIQEIPRMREKAYLNKDTISIIKGYIEWERSDLEIQVSYIVPSVLKQFDILGISLFGLPLGRTLLSMGFPIGLWGTKYVAALMDKKYPHNGKIEEELKRTKARWNHFKLALKNPFVMYLTLKKEFYLFFKDLILNKDLHEEKEKIDQEIKKRIDKKYSQKRNVSLCSMQTEKLLNTDSSRFFK